MDEQPKIKIYGNPDLPDSRGQRPLVTFALFAYNQEKYIREAVEGAFSQTYEPLEIILSDDCSTDRTFEIMKEMAAAYEGPHNVIVRKNKNNTGLAGHLNELAKVASGEIMTWAAGDDIAMPERTSEFIEVLNVHPEVDYVHSALEHISIEGAHLKFHFHDSAVRRPTVFSAIRGSGRITTQSCAFRRLAFEAYGPLRTTVTQEAMVMGFRASTTGVEYIPKPLTKYRIGCGTSTYQGRDVERLRWLEPMKVSGWYKSSLEQMLDDIEKTNMREKEKYRRIITRHLNYWTAINLINTERSLWVSMKCILASRRIGPELPRAILRVYTPSWLYRLMKEQSRSKSKVEA